MRRLAMVFVVVVNLVTVSPSLGWARTWTDKTGRFTVDAELVEVKDDKAFLRKADGGVIGVPISTLSEVDRN